MTQVHIGHRQPTETPTRPGMICVPPGAFIMGSDHHYPEGLLIQV